MKSSKSSKKRLLDFSSCSTCEYLATFRSDSFGLSEQSQLLERTLQQLEERTQLVCLERKSRLEVWQCAQCYSIWQYQKATSDNEGFFIRS